MNTCEKGVIYFNSWNSSKCQILLSYTWFPPLVCIMFQDDFRLSFFCTLKTRKSSYSRSSLSSLLSTLVRFLMENVLRYFSNAGWPRLSDHLVKIVIRMCDFTWRATNCIGMWVHFPYWKKYKYERKTQMVIVLKFAMCIFLFYYFSPFRHREEQHYTFRE